MTFWIAGATIVGAGLGYLGSKNAADTQSGAANRANDLQRQQYDQTRADQESFKQAGVTGQNRLMELLGVGGNNASVDYGKYGRDFSQQDFQQDPGYAFRLSEGLKALDRSASARGGLLSGGALKAATNYGQNAASQEYQNAFNRYQINRSNQLNPLQSLANQGQSSANFLGQAGTNYANAVGENYLQGANANAAGQVGGTNALIGGINQYQNYQQNQNLLNSLNKSSYSGGLPGYYNYSQSPGPSYDQVAPTDYSTYG